MFTLDPTITSVLLALVTSAALVARAWLSLRRTEVQERALTERQRQALADALPEQRAAILSALHQAEPPVDKD